MASVTSRPLPDLTTGRQAPDGRRRTAGRSAAGTELRPEIQALRAVAVGLVVVYHLWPKAVPGGFVGVDVFFAISGFLITSHLFRELDATGTVSLRQFWARRARRILPAALLVLLVCAIATLVLVPQGSWAQFFEEIRAATTYTQNWELASAAVDYLAAENAPSPVQHFWSLSAEEQFYLVWPVLILGAALIAARGDARWRRPAIAATLGTVVLASLAYSIHDTSADPAAAYFVTPTRAWEFGAGGLLALVGATDGIRPAVRAIVAWLGFAAIAVTAFTYSGSTPFPGYQAALPVLGTIAVMWAGAPALRWAPTPVVRLAPVLFLGSISYAVYLWHWPLLTLAPFALDHTAGTVTKVGVLVATIAGAWLTKIVVEDPARTTPLLTRRPTRVTFGAVAAATAVVIGATLVGDAVLDAQVRQDRERTQTLLAAKPTCFGAAARDPRKAPCDDPRLRTAVVPTPIEVRDADNSPCAPLSRMGAVAPCVFGTPKADARATVALLGDSHASHWRAALEIVADRERWRGISVTHTGCAFSLAIKDLVEPALSQCKAWLAQVPRYFAAHPEIHTIFVSEKAGGTVDAAAGQSQAAAQEAGFAAAWRTLPPSVRRIVIIRDTPTTRGSTLDCIQRAMDAEQPAGRACALRRSYALKPDYAVTAARRAGASRVRVVDLTRFMCDARRCYPVVGGALVYKDVHHLTTVFAQSLAPYLHRQVRRALATS